MCKSGYIKTEPSGPGLIMTGLGAQDFYDDSPPIPPSSATARNGVNRVPIEAFQRDRRPLTVKREGAGHKAQRFTGQRLRVLRAGFVRFAT